MSDANEDGRGADVFGTLDRRGVDVVVGEELNRALGAPRGVGDEDDRVPGLAAAPDLGHPVRDAAGKLERRLTRDVHGLVDRQRLERGCAVEPRDRFVPADHQLGRQGDVMSLGDGLVVAGVDLLRQLLAERAEFVRLRDEDGRPAAGPEIVECGCGSVGRVCTRDELLQRRNRRLIERAGRSLRRRVVGPDRLDRVADEFQADGLARAGGIEVDDPAAHAELAGLVHRILAGIAGARQQVAEVDRRDFLSGCQGEGDGAQALGGTQPG